MGRLRAEAELGGGRVTRFDPQACNFESHTIYTYINAGVLVVDFFTEEH